MVSLIRPGRRAALGAALGAAIALTPAGARAQASPYLPLDDVAYAYIDALQTRGELRELSALERPYTVQAVHDALARLQPAYHRSGWARALAGSLDKHYPSRAAADSGLFAATFAPYAIAQSSAVRDLMRADDARDATAGFTARLLMQAGPVTAVARGYGDQRLRDDPDFRGKKDRIVAGRMEDAYVAARWPLVEVAFGRTGRRWAGLGVQGLMVGDYTYSYDHLFARLGSERLHLSSIIARLDPMQVGAGDSVAQRYFTAHRLAGRLGSVDFGFTESIIYGGVDRGFDPSLASPTNVYSISQYAENRDINVLYGADFVWRPRWVGQIAAQFMLDDIQIDNCGPGCEEPPSYGVTLSVEGVPLVGDVRGFGSYVQLSSLAYRTINPWERYASQDVGLGLGYSDYDEGRIGLDPGAHLPFPVRGYIAVRRQGSGDYRAPFPSAQALPTTPKFLTAPVTTTFRIGVSGAARLLDALEVRGDVGINRVHRDTLPSYGAVEGRVTVALESARLRFTTGLR